jgi:seryl-tRNA synthetase
VRYAIELLTAEGFNPVVPPVLVREAPLFGTVFFPAYLEMIY